MLLHARHDATVQKMRANAPSSSQSKSLSISEVPKTPAKHVEIALIRRGRCRRRGVRQLNRRCGYVGPQLLGTIEIRRAAAQPRRHERLCPRRFAGKRWVRTQLGDGQGRPRQAASQYRRPPVETCLLEFPGQDVGAQRGLLDQMQVRRHHIKDLLVPEPADGLAMNFQSTRSELQAVPAVFQGSHVGIQRGPLVGNNRDSTRGCKLARDARVARSCRRLPRHGLDRIGLAQCF